jgi:hypothetical protein
MVRLSRFVLRFVRFPVLLDGKFSAGL